MNNLRTFWNFPAATGGLINSINNAGIETFRGSPINSLTREICQNSLDAVKDIEKPVVVEFREFTINEKSFPGRNEFLEAIRKCEETWRGRNKKSEEFIKNALEIFNKDEIRFLRISDFNTKGLVGAEKGELGSPWSSLIKEAGSSNKDESSGGSFGIGKSAPFLNSNLRTLFYSTVDINGYESHIGVANIMSFVTENNQTTLGNGYFTNNEISLAIPGQLILDPNFLREETGTDIYVSAFAPTSNWVEEVKKSVLFNFFITVWQKKLVVKVNEFEINHNNIEKLVMSLDDKTDEDASTLKHYFQLLTSDNALRVDYPTFNYKDIQFEEGEATLYLLSGEDLNRKVLMTRKTGMRIFEQTRISGSISFTGILMITGTNMNSVFKQMENPAHNEWSPERYEKNPSLAKKIYSDLRKFIRETVKEKFQEQVKESMDAVGLSDFLPNKFKSSEKFITKSESLDRNIKSILTIGKPKELSKFPNLVGDTPEEIEKQLVGEFGISPSGDKGGNGSGQHFGDGDYGAGTTNHGGLNQQDPNEEGTSNKTKENKPSRNPILAKHRYYCTDKEKGIYRVFVTPQTPVSNARLVFTVLGEQSDYALPIKSVVSEDSKLTISKISENSIGFIASEPVRNITMNIEIDYKDYCVMGVVLYEN